MSALTLRAEGPLDARVVWERYAVPQLWPTWSPHLRAVDYPGERLRAQTSGRVRGPLGIAAGFTVDEVDEDARTWSWTVRAGVVRLVLAHGVEGGPSGSATWLRMRGPLPVLLAYAPVAQYALGRLVRE